MKHTPATPLPWYAEAPMSAQIRTHAARKQYADIVAQVYECDGEQETRKANAAYIAHTANAYPKLVNEVKWLRDELLALANQGRASHNSVKRTEALLRSLGEDV